MSLHTQKTKRKFCCFLLIPSCSFESLAHYCISFHTLWCCCTSTTSCAVTPKGHVVASRPTSALGAAHTSIGRHVPCQRSAVRSMRACSVAVQLGWANADSVRIVDTRFIKSAFCSAPRSSCNRCSRSMTSVEDEDAILGLDFLFFVLLV